MRLEAGADAAAPLDVVLAHVADAEAHEALARRRGIAVERLGPAGPVGPGAAWRVGFEMLGARREGVLRLAALDASGLRLHSDTSGVEGEVTVALAPLAPERTRIVVTVVLVARTIGARVALGSMRPARGELERRLARGVGGLAARIGAEWTGEDG